MSILSVDNISPIGSGTSVTVNSAATLVLTNANSTGVITATTFSGSGASLTNLPAGNLTGALPAISGANLTGLSVNSISQGNSTAEILDTGTNGIFRFIPESNEVFRITHEAKVGINTNNPSHNLDISADGVAFPSAAGSTILRLRNSAGSATLSIDANAGNVSAIQFGDTAAASQGAVIYNHSSNHLQFNTGGSERLRITSGGHISQGGGAEPSSSNGSVAKKFGIKSNANNVIIGETESSGNGSGLHIESRQTGRSGDARIAQIGMKNDASGDGQISFFTAPNGSGVVERMVIDSNGYVTKPNHPSFHARRVSNVSATQNPLVYDAVHHNNGSHYKSSGTDQGKFVAPVSGVYLFYWTAIKTSSGTVTRLYINVDGSHIYSNMHLRLQEQGNYSNGSMQAIVNLNAGQKVHISLEVGSIHGNEYTHFGGYLIH